MKIAVFMAAVWCALSLVSSITAAEEKPPLPQTLPGAETVDAEALIALVGRRSALLLVDARITADREQGYIEGSISLPDIDTNCDSLATRVSADKALPVLFYCNGVKCGRSVKSIDIAHTCGYTELYWFRGGFEEWRDKDYPYLKK